VSAIPVYTINCDAGGCRARFRHELDYLAFTAKEARGQASTAGWTRTRRSGRVMDLCPNCTLRSTP
jgi:hypothetical protein